MSEAWTPPLYDENLPLASLDLTTSSRPNRCRRPSGPGVRCSYNHRSHCPRALKAPLPLADQWTPSHPMALPFLPSVRYPDDRRIETSCTSSSLAPLYDCTIHVAHLASSSSYCQSLYYLDLYLYRDCLHFGNVAQMPNFQSSSRSMIGLRTHHCGMRSCRTVPNPEALHQTAPWSTQLCGGCASHHVQRSTSCT